MRQAKNARFKVLLQQFLVKIFKFPLQFVFWVGVYTKIIRQLVAEGEVITSLYLLSRRRSEYRLVITKPEATNCFSIIFQVFTKNINTTL